MRFIETGKSNLKIDFGILCKIFSLCRRFTDLYSGHCVFYGCYAVFLMLVWNKRTRGIRFSNNNRLADKPSSQSAMSNRKRKANDFLKVYNKTYII